MPGISERPEGNSEWLHGWEREVIHGQVTVGLEVNRSKVEIELENPTLITGLEGNKIPDWFPVNSMQVNEFVDNERISEYGLWGRHYPINEYVVLGREGLDSQSSNLSLSTVSAGINRVDHLKPTGMSRETRKIFGGLCLTRGATFQSIRGGGRAFVVRGEESYDFSLAVPGWMLAKIDSRNFKEPDYMYYAIENRDLDSAVRLVKQYGVTGVVVKSNRVEE